MEIFEPGQTVRIKQEHILKENLGKMMTGSINSVTIGLFGVSYEIVYWKDGDRKIVSVSPKEIVKDNNKTIKIGFLS